jgi:hemoglobin-like flavoprotein
VNVTRRRSTPVATDAPLQGGLADKDVALVDASYRRLGTRGPAVSVAFFVRLHEAVPRLRRVFAHDEWEKRAVAKDLFDLVVGHLHAQSDLSALLERLGKRRLLDGVSAREVTAIGSCMLATLSEFDDAWSPEVERAWATIFVWASVAVRRGDRMRRSTPP